MISHRKIALLAVVAAQVNAFADDKTDKENEKKVVPYGLIQAYSNIADSQYGSTPDFTMASLRFGVKVSEGIARGQFETQFFGNVPDSGPISVPTVGFNSTVIRRADVGLALPSGTTLSLGRVRMGGADAWGLDATTTPDQFGSLDGVSLLQKISLGGDKNELNLSLGVGNSMGVPSGKDSHTFGRTLKSERGVVLGARVAYEGVVASAFYGMEKNQVKQEAAKEQAVIGEDGKPVAGTSVPVVDSNGAATTNVVKVPSQFVKLKKVMTARDASHFEGSLGYNRDNWAVGGWYQAVTRSDLKIATFEDGKFKVGSAATEADSKYGVDPTTLNKMTATVIGLGFNADSSLLGYTDVLQKGALLTLGGSVGQTAERDGDSANDSDEAKKDQMQYVIGVGYQVGGFAVELGHSLASSTGDNFNDKNAEQGADSTKKTSNYTYLMGIYSF